ncbi:MAG: ATP-binding cassette domain-containing protein, partial [Acidobacteriales bacterium]|nr:ATP-binding cassette domain-containing protein [Terriglobales bacterium]
MKLEQPQAGGQAGASRFSKKGRVLLSATGLRKAFGGQVVLNNLDLELREGEIVLLRGDNGSGKTTLLNILT